MKQIIDDKGVLLNSVKYSINYRILKDIQRHTMLVISGSQIKGCFYFLSWDCLVISEFYSFVTKFNQKKKFTENKKRK